MRFLERIRRFFAGRYGYDHMSWVLMIGGFLLLLVLQLLFRILLLFPPVGSLIGLVGMICTEILFWGLLVYLLFRALSRNIYKRQRENEAFERFWRPIADFFRLQRNKFRDRKNFVYRKCPEKSCRAVLRLPKKPGIHTVRCPKCGKRFETKI